MPPRSSVRKVIGQKDTPAGGKAGGGKGAGKGASKNQKQQSSENANQILKSRPMLVMPISDMNQDIGLQRSIPSVYSVGDYGQIVELPPLSSVTEDKFNDMLRQKLQQCRIVCNFADPMGDLKSKQLKQTYLQEILDHISQPRFYRLMEPETIQMLFAMIKANVIRTLPPIPDLAKVPMIGDDINGYMTVGISETGYCAEIFGRLGQGGSFINGMFDAFCKAFSIALQYGVPFDDFIGAFRYMSFDPAGWVRIGDYNEEGDKPEIHTCKSIVDLLMQLLDWMFPSENGRRLRQLDQDYIAAMFTNNGRTMTVKAVERTPLQTELPLATTTNAAVNTQKKKDKAMSSALTCPKCHSYAYVFDGKCRSCRDCGYKDGGCGA